MMFNEYFHHSADTMMTSFEHELCELKQDIEVAAHFGMEKLRYVRWSRDVTAVDELPLFVAPDTCVYVTNENTSYLFDGSGWVAFAAGVDLHTNDHCAGGDAMNIEHVNEVLCELQNIWDIEQSQGDICDEFLIETLDSCIQARAAWDLMLEQSVEKPRVLSSRA